MPSSKHIGTLMAIMTTFPVSLFAAPAIQQATVNDSGDVVIVGSRFGGGPTVALHEDFSEISISGDSVILKPQVGSWMENSKSFSVNPFIDQEYGTTSLIVRGEAFTKLIFGVPDADGPYGLKPFQEVYFGYTVRDLGEFPGNEGTATDFSVRSSTKDAWLMFGDKGDNTEWAVSQGNPAGHDLYVPAWSGGGFNIAGNNTRLSPTFWQPALTNNWAFQDWNTKMFHAKLDPSNPYGEAEGFFAFLNKNAYHVNVREGNLMEDQRSEGLPYDFWDRIKFFAWMNGGDADVNRVVDEIYVAIGENANARVLLTDGESLENSTRVFHLTPESWTDTEIVARFPDYLPEDKTYYLHVLDANNEASAGLNLCRLCPEAPQVFPVK